MRPDLLEGCLKVLRHEEIGGAFRTDAVVNRGTARSALRPRVAPDVITTTLKVCSMYPSSRTLDIWLRQFQLNSRRPRHMVAVSRLRESCTM